MYIKGRCKKYLDNGMNYIPKMEKILLSSTPSLLILSIKYVI